MAVRSQNSTKTKTLILDAARRQFAHYGFSKVTMDEIAQDAALGKASIYYYFPTKENLFQAVMTSEHDRFMKQLEGMIGMKIGAAAKIREYVLERHEYFKKMLNLNILDLRSSASMKPIFAETYERFAKQELGLLRRLLKQGCESGEFSVRSIDRVAVGLMHTMQGLRCRFLRAIQGPPAESDGYDQLKEEIGFVADIFLNGIRK